jgi:ABC-type amino acid transport substrate-binding protein
MRTPARVTIHALIVLLSLFVLRSSAARADTLDEIRQRGTLRWGGDASGGGPYIYEGGDGTLTGFEYDLAEHLAAKLGVRAEFVQWEWENLPLILTSGKIDVVLNGFEWSGEREAHTSYSSWPAKTTRRLCPGKTS